MEILQSQNTDFLTGGGECGEIIRSIDWSKTPIGPVENWPQSLKTCVRIVLTSRQPMFVWWGKELINIYNDPYKAIVGGKHPEALGLPASVVWREIWNQVSPRAEKAMLNNEGTYDEALLLIMERNGYPEETYYTFSYSPVPGDHGEPGGIICANTDDTQRIIGERQLRTLRDLGKNIFENKIEKEVYEKSIRVLKQNPQDFPFALLYKTKPGDTFMKLENGTEAVPENIFPLIIDTTDPYLRWPVQEVFNSGKEKIVEIEKSIGALPTGAWNKQPDKILILPVAQSGQKNPYALLFIGLNPYSLFDEKQQGFYQLVADQISSNIADMRAYEDERKRAEALAEIDKAKTVFFSNISHEFRTPLTLMISPLEEALRENNSLPQALRENLDVSYRNTLRLQKLVNSLLDFSRIEAGRMQVSYQLTDITALTRDIASNFRSAVEKAGMELVVDCETISDQVYIDRDMWEKIVLNLLSNAFKYTHKGTIKVILKKNGKYVELSVIDTGVGIPESEINKVFDRFHRVQHARGRTQEGTGIGLSLVQELVKLHHGNIRVTSKVNEGSTFSVIIPVGKEHLDNDKIYESTLNLSPASSPDHYIEEAMKGIPASAHNNISGMNADENNSSQTLDKEKLKPYIILADDNEDMRNYIHRLLRDDYEVNAVKNGKEVLKNIENRIPDLIISDVMMPEIDGFELVRKLKNDKRTANIPIVLLSARAGEEATIEGLKTGADDYLVKPFSAKELLIRIDSTLKIAENRRVAEQNLERLITERTSELENRNEELQQQKDFVDAILDSSVDVISVFDTEKRYLSLNKRCEEAYGIKKENVIGKKIDELFPQTINSDFYYGLSQAILGNNIHHPKYQSVVTGRNYETFYIPLKHDGKVYAVLAIAHDNTEIMDAAERLQLSNIQLEQKNRELEWSNSELEQFAYVASHDLQEPLRKIRTYSGILYENMRSETEGTSLQTLQKIMNSAERMSTLIYDLLNFSRLIHPEKTFEPTDLNKIIHNVVNDFELTIQQKQALIHVDTLPLIRANPLQMNQLFYNLLNNSLKFSRENLPPVITITSTVLEAKDVVKSKNLNPELRYIDITVKDNGIGFDQQYAEQIFEVFKRLQNKNIYPGSGIGLALCRKILLNHKGDIYAEGKENEGAVFHIILPAGHE